MSDMVREYFTQAIQTKISAAELLSEPIAQGAAMMTNVLLAAKKIFVCGHGSCGHLASLLAAQLLHHHEVKRPPLPVIALNQGFSSDVSQDNDQFSRSLQALGQAGDLLVVITTDTASHEILNVTETALTKDMSVLVLATENNLSFNGKLGINDLEIGLPGHCTKHSFEVALMVIHCLAELVEDMLFPNQEGSL